MFIKLGECFLRDDVEGEIFDVKAEDIGARRQEQSVLVDVELNALGGDDARKLDFNDEKLGIFVGRIFEDHIFRLFSGRFRLVCIGKKRYAEMTFLKSGSYNASPNCLMRYLI